MRKFNRLSSIEEQVVRIIRELTKVTVNTTHASIRDSFLRSYGDTGSALEMGAGINLQFSRLPQSAIANAVSDDLWLNALKRHNGLLLSDVKWEMEKTLRENARYEVAEGLAEGKPYSAVAKAIKERFDVTATRAKTISFTEMHRAHSAGRLEGIDRAGKAAEKLGLKVVKVWRHNHIGVPRPSHLAADGQMVGTDEMFNIGGVLMSAPGIGGGPEDVINCHCSAQVEILGLDELKGKAA
jgi:hypothetical protein